MALVTFYETERGISRLLRQPADVKVRTGKPSPAYEDAALGYQRLFKDYLADLGTVYEIAAPWWEGTIESQMALGLDRAAAIVESFNRRAAGAASHPNFVWLVRYYWLECDDLGQELENGQVVQPEIFLLRWVIDAGEIEFVRLIACMPYWPIGLDADGNWC